MWSCTGSCSLCTAARKGQMKGAGYGLVDKFKSPQTFKNDGKGHQPCADAFVDQQKAELEKEMEKQAKIAKEKAKENNEPFHEEAFKEEFEEDNPLDETIAFDDMMTALGSLLEVEEMQKHEQVEGKKIQIHANLTGCEQQVCCQCNAPDDLGEGWSQQEKDPKFV